MSFLVTGGSGFIGTNLIDCLIKNKEEQIINLDIKEPKKETHRKYWYCIDLLDEKKLNDILIKKKPTHIVHLAARTDTDKNNNIDGYKANTEGTRNLISAIKLVKTTKRLIITSTQFVHQCQGIPKDDEDYAPHTAYGQSKVITEQLVRKADLNCLWTIIRPTNIWGPWHPRYPKEFWLVLKKGLYFHPGKQPVVRSYGYVGNVTHQILKILELPAETVHGRVFYVGDRPINLLDWVNGFSNELIHRDVIVIPRFLVQSLAKLGDFLSLFHLAFPLNSSRFKSMTIDNPAPMDETFKVLGESPYSLARGIKETAKWLKEND